MGRFFTDIWQFYDFQNGGRPLCWNLKMCSCCHVALVDLLFCFLIHNVAEIGQSVNGLWPKKTIFKMAASRWRPPPSWILKISIFGHVTVTGFNIWCSVPNFIKIGQFFTDIMAILRFWKWRPSAMLDSKNLQFLSRSPCRPAVLLTHTKFCWNRTIGRWFMAKKRFSRWWP